jgi:hypothetical protein
MESRDTLKEAVLWESAEEQKVRCRLCSFCCWISEGKRGHCNVRKNIGGKLYSLNYCKVCAANPDPIEKKPLYHVLPGSRSFSIAAVGCNFRCEFCQNWQISQAALETGRIDGENRMRPGSAAPASRSRTRGWRTATGPMPVITSRSAGSIVFMDASRANAKHRRLDSRPS